MERLPTSCAAVDQLMDGGLATGTITQVFGEKALGKSIFSFQAACSAVASGSGAVIIDTEQSYSSYLLPYWLEAMGLRFGKEVRAQEVKLERSPRGARKGKGATRGQLLTAIGSTLDRLGVDYTEAHLGTVADTLSPDFAFELPANGPAVTVLQLPEVVDLLSVHGIDTAKEVSSGGRVELRLRRSPRYESALRALVKETGAKLLVYDSVSAPFKSSFPSTQDLPARSSGLAMLLSHAQRLCVEFGISVLVVSHVSIDPINAWDRRPYGGIILGHEAKFCLELTRGTAKRSKHDPVCINPEEESEKARAFWVARHPALEEYSRFGYSTIDKEGFH
jgi:RecA/RadA recombinase